MKNIKIFNKLTNELILEFNCNDEDIEIINNIPAEIRIKISKENYDFLREKNYLVTFDCKTVVFSGELTEEEINVLLDNNKTYFLVFSLMFMDDEMLEEFNSMSIFNLSYVEKEFKKIEYKDTEYKTQNLLLYIDDKEINISETIMNKMNELDVKKQLLKSKVMAKMSHYVSGNIYYTVELEDGIYQFPIATVDVAGQNGIDSPMQYFLSSDLGTTTFNSEMRGSELNRWISKAIKAEEFVKIG